MVVEASIDIMREVVGEDCGYGRNGMVREGETPLCRSRCGSVRQRASSVEDGYIGRGWGIGGCRGSEVFSRRGEAMKTSSG